MSSPVRRYCTRCDAGQKPAKPRGAQKHTEGSRECLSFYGLRSSVDSMKTQARFSRRDVLRAMGMGGAVLSFSRLVSAEQKNFVEPPRVLYKGSDDDLLNDIERAAFDFFWTEAGTSGQVKDRALLNGQDTRMIASIAATGFGLTA